MNKLKAILRGASFEDKLAELREREINRAIESAKDDAERQMTEAEIKQEELYNQLGAKSVNYNNIINEMIKQRDVIRRAKETIKEVEKIKTELDSDVELK